MGKKNNTRSQPAKGRKPIIVFKIVLICLGLLAGAAFAEVAFRVLNVKPPKIQGKRYLKPLADRKTFYVCYPTNPNGEFAPVPDVSKGDWELSSSSLPPRPLPLPDLQSTPWCVEDRTSDQGLRDRHYEKVATPGKVRIAMVGDSFVRGEGVPLEKTLPRQLEGLMGTNKLEVMNVGFVGLGTEEEVGNARSVSQKLGVQRVILVFIPNDIRLSTALDQRQTYINDLINIREEHLAQHHEELPLYRASRVVQMIDSVFEMREITRQTVNWYLDSYDPAFNAKGLEMLAGNFKILAAMPNCRVVLVLYPLLFGVEKNYPLAPIHQAVKKMAEESGLKTLDLAPAFRGHAAQSLQVNPCDHHPNGRANAIAAEAISEWLKRDVPEFLAEDSAANTTTPSAPPSPR